MKKKTLEAENVALLKHLIDLELRRLKEEANLDMILFSGVDGRMFSSNIPDAMDKTQFFLLNLVKGNMPYLCAQLSRQNLQLSVNNYKEGSVVISGVGDNAFLVSIIAGEGIGLDQLATQLKAITKSSAVIRHIFEAKPMTEAILDTYPEEVSTELKKISRLLFKERFSYTKGYKKNMQVLEVIKAKVESLLGKGTVDEIVQLTFNEMGTTAQYMTDANWIIFLEKVIDEHITRHRGDIIADECRKTWIPEISMKIKSFV